MADLSAWLRLTLIAGIGGDSQRKLLSAFGMPEAVFNASRADLLRVLPERMVRLLLSSENEERVREAGDWPNGIDQHILTLADAEYPQSLLNMPDPPTLLYVRGRLDLLNRPGIAVVGSRSPTPQGILNAEQFSASLAEAGLVIVSGLALGIDAAAHRGALAVNGGTVALVGTGIDRIYPARNKELALDIGRRGAIVSEFPLGTPVSAANFPRRNRLISGISRGVLVVEAACESGSLITARLAAEQGREVFAIPGSIHSPVARGCHQLIKQGAKLVETAQDILEEFRPGYAYEQPIVATGIVSLPPSGDPLLESLGFDSCTLDEISHRSGLPVDRLSAKLLQLELSGLVASLPGGLYQRITSGTTR